MRVSGKEHISGSSPITFNARAAVNTRQNTKDCDILTISKTAKNAFKNQSDSDNMLNSLLKQKQHIADSKNSLIEKTLEQDKSLADVKDQLADYDDQLKNIDKQISDYMLQEKKKALGTDEKDESKDDAGSNEPKNKQEMQNEKLNGIVLLDSNIQDIRSGMSIKEKLEGQSKVLKTEIKVDEARSISGLPATAKRDEVAKINASIDNLTKMLSDKLTDTQKKIENTKNASSSGNSESSDDPQKTSALQDSGDG